MNAAAATASNDAHRGAIGVRAALLACLAVAACEREQSPAAGSATAAPLRAGRFGSLRDLVLFERADASPGDALFVDRFEATQGDWAPFARSDAGRAVAADQVPTAGDPSLPVSLMSLRQARAFARWRFLRLPRYDEWHFVAVGDGRSTFPWGNRADSTRANTMELGLAGPTPVGTFESGLRASGQPYDLIGNVSEWTETVSARWSTEYLDPQSGAEACWRAVLAAPALSVWQAPCGLVPMLWPAAAGGDAVPRDVVGADFQSEMITGVLGAEAVPAGDRRTRTGLRLCATASELLQALASETAAPSVADAEQVRRFLHRGDHLGVLAAAWAALRAAHAIPEPQPPLAALLQRELGGAAPPRNGR